MVFIFGANGGIGSGLLASAALETEVFGVFRQEVDVTKDAEVEAFFANINRIGVSNPLHVVNATGHLHNGVVHRVTEEEIVATVDANLLGSWRIAKHFATAAKTRPGSSLLLLSSVVGRSGVAGAASYGMCKSGLHGLVRSACKEFARFDARVNAVEMGYFDVGMIERIPAPKRKSIEGSVPLQRFGRPAELWQMCHAILNCEYMTGAVVPVTGGL